MQPLTSPRSARKHFHGSTPRLQQVKPPTEIHSTEVRGAPKARTLKQTAAIHRERRRRLMHDENPQQRAWHMLGKV
jgi:hypothetical protein